MTRWNNGSDEVGAVSADITSETNALPAKYFTDPDVFEMEKEAVFGQYWIYAGHEARDVLYTDGRRQADHHHARPRW